MDTPHAHSVVGITYFTEYSKSMGPVTSVTFNFSPYYNKWLMETKTTPSSNRNSGKGWEALVCIHFHKGVDFVNIVHSNAIWHKDTGLSPDLHAQIFFQTYGNKLPVFTSSTLVTLK